VYLGLRLLASFEGNLPVRVMDAYLDDFGYPPEFGTEPQVKGTPLEDQALIYIASQYRWATTFTKENGTVWRPQKLGRPRVLSRTRDNFLAPWINHQLLTVCRGDVLTAFDDDYHLPLRGTGLRRCHSRVRTSLPVKQVTFDDLSEAGIIRSWENPVPSNYLKVVRVVTLPGHPVISVSAELTKTEIELLITKLCGKLPGNHYHEVVGVNCSWGSERKAA
jgi:hypothetical protein